MRPGWNSELTIRMYYIRLQLSDHWDYGADYTGIVFFLFMDLFSVECYEILPEDEQPENFQGIYSGYFEA